MPKKTNSPFGQPRRRSRRRTSKLDTYTLRDDWEILIGKKDPPPKRDKDNCYDIPGNKKDYFIARYRKKAVVALLAIVAIAGLFWIAREIIDQRNTESEQKKNTSNNQKSTAFRIKAQPQTIQVGKTKLPLARSSTNLSKIQLINQQLFRVAVKYKPNPQDLLRSYNALPSLEEKRTALKKFQEYRRSLDLTGDILKRALSDDIAKQNKNKKQQQPSVLASVP